MSGRSGWRGLLGERRLRALRNSRGYDLWRRFREEAQIAEVAQLLSAPESKISPYDEAELQTVLRSRASARRRPAPGEPLRVASYGASDWEQNGLWQSVRRLGDGFHTPLRRDGVELVQRRAEAAKAFLAELDRADAAGRPIHLAFFYAGGADLEVSLLNTLRERGVWTVLMGLDDKQQITRTQGPEARQTEVARAVDVYWTTWRAGADWLLWNGATPWYAPEAADPAFFHPVPGVERDLDVLWMGRLYGPRAPLVRFLQEQGVRVAVHGPGSPGGPVSFEEMLRLFSRAKVVLGMGGVGQTDAVKHLKGRDFEAPMCGALYLTSFNPELTDHFQVGKEILCYASPVECLDVLRWILRRPEDAQRIRDAALARSRACHTWDARFLRLTQLMGL